MECFIALGGNFEKSLEAMEQALHMLAQNVDITDLCSSRLYQTSPVSEIEQPSFLNACARFKTHCSLLVLFQKLEEIEKILGKVEKKKNAPRLIDIDLLFYGDVVFQNEYLEVPHPRFHQRLFVLAPLSDLIETIPMMPSLSIKSMIKNFNNINNEQVVLLNTRLPYDEKKCKSC